MKKKTMYAVLTALGLSTLSFTTVYAANENSDNKALERNSVRFEQMQESMQETRNAVESKDYDTFAKLYKERTGEEISKDSFNKILELHELKQKEISIMEELKNEGVKMPGFTHPHMGKKANGQKHMGMMENINK